LNSRSLIQPSETLPVELTGNHYSSTYLNAKTNVLPPLPHYILSEA